MFEKPVILSLRRKSKNASPADKEIGKIIFGKPNAISNDDFQVAFKTT